MNGVVKKFNDAKGWGFLGRDDGQPDVFVHHSHIVVPAGTKYRTLNEGDRVTFEIIQTEKGPAAANVKVALSALAATP